MLVPMVWSLVTSQQVDILLVVEPSAGSCLGGRICRGGYGRVAVGQISVDGCVGGEAVAAGVEFL